MEFFVRLCLDVLLEALRFGDRHCLAKVNRIGRRFYRAIENHFVEAPFIRLDLELLHWLFIPFSVCMQIIL